MIGMMSAGCVNNTSEYSDQSAKPDIKIEGQECVYLSKPHPDAITYRCDVTLHNYGDGDGDVQLTGYSASSGKSLTTTHSRFVRANQTVTVSLEWTVAANERIEVRIR